MSRISSLIVGCLLLFCSASAQHADTLSLQQAVNALNKALVLKDEKMLKWLLADGLNYGHSNGWIESKEEVITDLKSGKLSYEVIRPLDQQLAVDGTTGVVWTKAEYEVLLEGKSIALKLSVLQIWSWRKKKGWVLMGRQSVKME